MSEEEKLETKLRKPRGRPTVRSPKDRAGRRLNSIERAEAIAMWRSGQYTLDEICKKLNRTKGVFIKLFKEENINKGENSEVYAKRVEEAVEKATLSSVEELTQRIKETKEDHYKMAQGLSKLVWHIIATCKKEGRSFTTISGEMKALRYASMILKSTREDRYAILGLNKLEDDENKAPEDLTIREITVEEIRDRIKNQVGSEDEFFNVPDIDDVPIDEEDRAYEDGSEDYEEDSDDEEEEE